MKRVLLLVLAVVLTLGLVAGCVEIKTYDDEGQAIDIGVGQEFIIALGSNPGSTGYSWQASYDETRLELAKWNYVEPEGGALGAGGVEYFQFRALKAGEAEITLIYKQPWEGGGFGETKIFTVNID